MEITTVVNAEAVKVLDTASGRAILEAVYQRHQQYPYVYEEQSMVLTDAKGHKETRKLRSYSRVEQDGSAYFLVVFDSPEDVKGVAVLAERTSSGMTRQSIYLPAFGRTLINNSGESTQGSFLGSDFSIENLIGEELNDYTYKRIRDAIIDGSEYYLIDVYESAAEKPLLLRRHFVSKNNLYISRTDYFDELGRLQKCQTQHDLTPVLGDMWRANMMLMQDHVEKHQTLIKTNRRVFSADYVPAEIFTVEWLYANGLEPIELELEEPLEEQSEKLQLEEEAVTIL